MKLSKKSTTKSRKVLADVEVAPEATDLLFEVEDVADVIAEITGEDVEVTADENTVEFQVGEDVYVVDAEEDTESVESCRQIRKSAKRVSASTSVRKPSGRPLRKMPRRK